ncbi:MAG: hypothetical protein AB1571_00285 [Nanoarchaeota archaeon]
MARKRKSSGFFKFFKIVIYNIVKAVYWILKEIFFGIYWATKFIFTLIKSKAVKRKISRLKPKITPKYKRFHILNEKNLISKKRQYIQ